MMRALREVRWTILTTIAIGVFLSSSATDYVLDMYRTWYDDTHPVVVMSGKLVELTDDTATIHVIGVKLRPCRFVALHSYTSAKGLMTDAYRLRLGQPEDGTTKPVGKHDYGVWRIWPTAGADKVVMTVMHECSGRLVTAQIAEVPL